MTTPTFAIADLSPEEAAEVLTRRLINEFQWAREDIALLEGRLGSYRDGLCNAEHLRDCAEKIGERLRVFSQLASASDFNDLIRCIEGDVEASDDVAVDAEPAQEQL
jgi:hypothetical protein